MNKRFLGALTSVCFLLAVGFAPFESASARNLAPAPNAYDVVAAVNSLRAAHGLPAYNANPILMRIAQSQADYLASTGGAYGHIGPGGTRPYQRALAAGYPVAGDLSLGGWFSENWLAGNYSASGAVNSPGWADAAHQSTMLSLTFQDIGAGVATSGGATYFVIDCGLASGSKVSTPSSGGGTVAVVSGTPVTATQDNRIAVAIVSTPDAKGNIYHIVQPGQTLWQIAIAYKTTIATIKQKNNLPSNDITVGQKLFIAFADTPTPLPPTTATATLDLSTATMTPTLEVFTETPTATVTAVVAAPASGPAGSAAVVAIVVVALFAAGLAAWAGRSRPV